MNLAFFQDLFKITARISSILIAIIFASVGSNMIFILIPVDMQAAGIPPSVIGLVMAGYSVGILVGSNYGQLLIARVGYNRSYAAVSALIAIAASLHSFLDITWANFLLRFLVGFSMAVIFLILESWLNATSELHSRGTIYAMYQLFLGFGMFSAPFIATIFDPGDVRAFSIVSMVMCCSLIPLALSRYPSPQLTGNQEHLSLIEMLRDTPSGAVSSILGGLLVSVQLSLMSLFALWLNLTSGEIAILLAASAGSSIAFQLPIGRLSDLMDERKLLLIIFSTILASALLIISFGLAKADWRLIACLVFICGGSISCIYPLSVKLIFNQMATEKALPAMSSLLIFFSSGMIIGPIIASTMMDYLTPLGIFYYFSGLMIIAIPFMAYRAILGSTPSEDMESVPYMITIQSLRPSSASLDPRTEYLATQINNATIQALANNIAQSPSKAEKLIRRNWDNLNRFKAAEILEALVLLKPRLAKPIIRAMLNINDDHAILFTKALGDLISLNKPMINALILQGLTHLADDETKLRVQALFDEYIAYGSSEP